MAFDGPVIGFSTHARPPKVGGVPQRHPPFFHGSFPRCFLHSGRSLQSTSSYTSSSSVCCSPVSVSYYSFIKSLPNAKPYLCPLSIRRRSAFFPPFCNNLLRSDPSLILGPWKLVVSVFATTLHAHQLLRAIVKQNLPGN